MTLAMIGATISKTKPTYANGLLPLSWSPRRATRPPFHHIVRMAPVGHQRDRADHRDRQRRHEDVVVADVAQLVGHDAFELDPVHLLEQSGGDGDRRVVRVAAGRERIRGRVVDDVDARLREPAGDAQTLDQVVEALVLLLGRRPGPADRQRDLVGLPVRRERDAPLKTSATSVKARPLPTTARSPRRRARRRRRTRRRAACCAACSIGSVRTSR